MTEERRSTIGRRSTDVEFNSMYSRVSVLETQMQSLQEQATRHEFESKEVWVKMAQTLDDIKDELTNFRFSKLEDNKELEKEIRELNDKLLVIETQAATSWKIATVIGSIVGFLITFIANAFDLFK